MRIGETGHKVESSGLEDTGSFSIKNSPHAFRILSSGLYSNKIRAVIRELSCNAVDAHTAAGQGKKPIEVKLPNANDKQFFVKDFGTGLTHEQVMKLYTTYFESTKQESNDFIGGLGVGSKSPFAYTDSFTVESRKDGVKRLYAAYLAENGTPAISKMHEEPTSEPNGMTIGFPVDPTDFKEFSSEALSVFRSFKVSPTLRGVPYKVEPVVNNLKKLTDTVYLSSESNNFPWNNCVRMGNVIYPLDLKKVTDGDEFLGWITSKQGIFIDVPIGTYSVAASREQLQYDPATVDAFKKDMDAFKEAWLKSARTFLKSVEPEKNEHDRKMKIFKWLDDQGITHRHFWNDRGSSPEKILSSLRKNHGLDIPVVTGQANLSIDTENIRIVEPYISSRAGQKRVVWPNFDADSKKLAQTNVHIDYTKPLNVIYADTKQYKDVVSALIAADTTNTKFVIIVNKKDGDPAKITSEKDAAVAKLGKVEPTLVSAIPRTAGVALPKSGAATTKEEIRACTLDTESYYGDRFQIMPSQMKVVSNADSFVWLPYTPSSKEYNGKSLTENEDYELGFLLNSLENLEKSLGKTPSKVYAVNTIYRKRMDAFPTAILLEKHIENLLDEQKLKTHIDKPRELVHVEYDGQSSRGYGSRHEFTRLSNLATALKTQKLGDKLTETLPKDVIDSRVANLCIAVNSVFGNPIGTLKNIKIVAPEKIHEFIAENYPLISSDVMNDNYSGKQPEVKRRVEDLNKYIGWKDQTENINVSF